MKKNIIKLVIDIVQFVVFVALFIFGEFSNFNHELLGVFSGLLFIVHIILNWKILFRCSNNFKRVFTFVLNQLTGISIIVCVLSGILISETFPIFNIGVIWMRDVHYYSYIIMIISIVLHIITHLNYLLLMLKQANKKSNYIVFISIIFSLVIVVTTMVFGELISNGSFDYQDDININEESNDNTETEDNSLKIFNSQTLSEYNGKNGMPAYIAVDGVVYDVSSIFSNGSHHGYFAGNDLTNAFNKEHSSIYLDGLTIVGSYEN